MKLTKSILLVAATVLITVGLFSFKIDGPKKEYCKLVIHYLGKAQIQLITVNEVKEISIEKGENDLQKIMKTINDLSNEGWTMSSSSAYNATKPNVGNPFAVTEMIYFERTK